jgi:hypothetical protein
MDGAAEKHHAHELIELLPDSQLAVAVRFLESMLLDPVAAALRNAPMDDEPETEEEKQAVAEARVWLERNGGKGIPHDEAMRRLGMG